MFMAWCLSKQGIHLHGMVVQAQGQIYLTLPLQAFAWLLDFIKLVTNSPS